MRSISFDENVERVTVNRLRSFSIFIIAVLRGKSMPYGISVQRVRRGKNCRNTSDFAHFKIGEKAFFEFDTTDSALVNIYTRNLHS